VVTQVTGFEFPLELAGQKVACPTCGSQTLIRSLEPPRIKIPAQRLPTASHREAGMAGIAPVSRKILDNDFAGISLAFARYCRHQRPADGREEPAPP